MIKNIYKKIIPKRVQNKIHLVRGKVNFEIRLLRAVFSDYWRYQKYANATMNEMKSIDNLSSMIMMEHIRLKKLFLCHLHDLDLVFWLSRD